MPSAPTARRWACRGAAATGCGGSTRPARRRRHRSGFPSGAGGSSPRGSRSSRAWRAARSGRGSPRGGRPRPASSSPRSRCSIRRPGRSRCSCGSGSPPQWSRTGSDWHGAPPRGTGRSPAAPSHPPPPSAPARWSSRPRACTPSAGCRTACRCGSPIGGMLSPRAAGGSPSRPRKAPVCGHGRTGTGSSTDRPRARA